MQQDAQAFAMRSHQGSQGHGSAQIRCCTDSYLKDLHKLQEMLTVRGDQGAVEVLQHGPLEETGGRQKSRATASTGRISSDHVQRLRNGEARDLRRPVVGAGAGSRSSPSMTKLSIPAWRWKHSASPDLHAELALRPPSPPSPATEESVTAVADQRNKHSHTAAGPEAKPNPGVTRQTFPDRVADSTAERSQHSETSPATTSSQAVDDSSRARYWQGSFTAAPQCGESESTNAPAGHSDHARLHRKQRPSGSAGCRLQGAGTGAVENEPAEAIAQAAAALLMLSSDETRSPSSPSSSSSSAGRPFSWAGATRATEGRTGGEDISLEGGATRSGSAGDEDAMAGSVLSRPWKQRRYRLMAELLAETPRAPPEGAHDL